MKFQYNSHLTIGFAGKRFHEKLDLIRPQLERLFSGLDEKLKDTNVRFMTGLADGADQIAANTFVDFFSKPSGTGIRSLGAILPFKEEDYVNTIVEGKEFAQLLGRCDQVLELDGKYGTEIPHSQIDRAYQQQGRVLAKLSDIFIAAVPKSDKGKIGGTMEALIFALTLGKPVIMLNLETDELYLYQKLDEWFGDDVPISIPEITEALLPVSLAPNDVELEDIFPRGLIYETRVRAWKWFERIFKGKKPVSTTRNESALNPLHKQLLTIKQNLDNSSVYYQLQYRGGYILNYALSITAVLLAVTSSIFLGEREHLSEQTLTYTLIVLGLSKIVVIGWLIFNTHNINHNEYNRKAIDYRYAAERLRANCFMSILGVLRSPQPSLGNHSKKHFSDYRGESIYQSVMSVPFQSSFRLVINQDILLRFLDSLQEDWVGQQKIYHSGESDRMKKMDNRLQELPEIFSYAVVGIVIIDLIVGFTVDVAGYHPYHWMEFVFPVMVPIMLGLTTFFPAVVSVLNGIHFQSESHRLSVRSEMMAKELEKYEERIRIARKKLQGNSAGCNFNSVFDLGSSAASLLIDEVAEWSLIYEKRVYDQG